MTEINSLGFKCICPSNFSGLFCETSMHQPFAFKQNLTQRRKQADLDALICRSHECGPNGVCININNKLPHCLCKEPYYGDRCQNRDGCFDNPCKPTEICLQWPNNTFVCHDARSAPNTLPPSLSPTLRFQITNEFTRPTTLRTNTVEETTTEKKPDLKETLELNCTDDYCSHSGVCKVIKNAANESLMRCICNTDKTGPRCETG